MHLSQSEYLYNINDGYLEGDLFARTRDCVRWSRSACGCHPLSSSLLSLSFSNPSFLSEQEDIVVVDAGGRMKVFYRMADAAFIKVAVSIVLDKAQTTTMFHVRRQIWCSCLTSGVRVPRRL